MRLLLICLLLLIPSLVNAQTPPVPVLQEGQVFAWDYVQTDIAKFAVTRFEVTVDGTVLVNATPDTGTPSTTTGNLTYRVAPPALTTGRHSVELRACRNTTLSSCSAAVVMAFDVFLEPVPVFNLRIEPAIRPPGE